MEEATIRYADDEHNSEIHRDPVPVKDIGENQKIFHQITPCDIIAQLIIKKP